jgi:thymidylate synthase (FAD)
MRYCNYGKLGLQVICPPSIDVAPGEYDWNEEMIPDADFWTRWQWTWVENRVREYEEYLNLIELGIPPEDARFGLPNATKTEVVCTYNLRTWRHVIRERGLNKHAQWEIRGIFGAVHDELRERMPSVFGDLV